MSNYGCFSISENQNNIKGRNLIYATVEIQFKILNIYFSVSAEFYEGEELRMSEVIISDYFYGDEAEQFQYFRIPRQLITNARFKQVSTDAKLLYGMLLDRMSLSVKNEWYDDNGRVYIYITPWTRYVATWCAAGTKP